MNLFASPRAARAAAGSAAEGALGFLACAAAARLVCPAADFPAALLGLGLAWAAAAAGVAALSAASKISFSASLAAFWAGIGLRALVFLALAALCWRRPGAAALSALVAYAVGVGAALLFLESRWIWAAKAS